MQLHNTLYLRKTSVPNPGPTCGSTLACLLGSRDASVANSYGLSLKLHGTRDYLPLQGTSLQVAGREPYISLILGASSVAMFYFRWSQWASQGFTAGRTTCTLRSRLSRVCLS